MGDLALDNARAYSMRELNQRTADVIREVNESGVAAPITRHGRFVALLVPLAGSNVESAVLAAVLESAEQYHQLVGERTAEEPLTEEQVADELDLNLPRRR